jgi:gamma-glutamylcyclotransferase
LPSHEHVSFNGITLEPGFEIQTSAVVHSAALLTLGCTGASQLLPIMAYSSTPRLYFAYGSSLSISEMKSRCPTCTFYSIAILRNHRWFVNERGYANIAPLLPGPNGIENVVWGILYNIRPFDEELLDKQESIPWAYSKSDMDVEAVSYTEDGRGTRREVVRALVYIDRERVQESYPWPEFITKMNNGIQEAAERGVPRMWIDKVVKIYLVEPSSANGAERQAEVKAISPTHSEAKPLSATRPESDRGSYTQEVLPAGPTVLPILNDRLQNGRPSQIAPLFGLEKSKYAHDRKLMSGAQQRKATIQNRGPLSSAQPHDNKQLECWWWKIKGSCRFSDQQCAFAHHTTGTLANAPPGKKRAPSSEKQNASFQPNSTPRRNPSPSFSKPNAGKENEKQADASQQSSSAQQGRVDANPSWSDQVENLMDSEPEWLVSNDRKDVKW